MGQELTAKLQQMYDAAMRDYRARCLWHAQPNFDVDGMKTIAKLLKQHGNMEAWRLATEIERALDDAA